MRVLSSAPTQNPVVERILERARQFGPGPFLTLVDAGGNETSLSYEELVGRAQAWTARYRDSGLPSGARVIVILEHGEPLYASYLGALLGGFVPAFFAPPSKKIQEEHYRGMVSALLERSGGDFVVTSRAIHESLNGKLDAPHGLFEDGTLLPGIKPAPTSTDAMAPGTLFLQFSSGTTGLKKGVAVSARALLWQVDAYGKSIGAGRSDLVASWLPLYHDMGLIACFFLPLLCGVRLVAMSPFDWVAQPSRLLDAVTRHRATLLWLPNFAYNFLASRVTGTLGCWDLSSLRKVINCSEPVLDGSHRAFLERFAPMGLNPAALASCYALSENTFAVTSGGIDAPLRTNTTGGRVAVSSGSPLPETRVEILDADGAAVAEGQPGEIAIGSPSLFSGYVGSLAETAARFRNGLYCTGDLGYLREGELYVLGRSRDTIIVSGRNVFPEDVEAAVAAVAGTIPGRCVAFGIDTPSLGTQALVVVAETNEHIPAARADLRRRIHEAIVGTLDIVPADIALADHMWLRKSTSGKLARSNNRARYLEAKGGGAAAATRQGSSIEEAVRDCIAHAIRLGGARIAPQYADDEDLVAAGIVDSFALVSLQLALAEKFGNAKVQVIPELLRSNCSVRALAAVLRGAAPAAAAQTRGAIPPGDRKAALAPQMKDAERQPYQWVAYQMRRGMPNFSSPSLSSDEHGFRSTWREGVPIRFKTYMNELRSRGLVLGNSLAYGVGTTHDSKTFTSVLNENSSANLYIWYNFSQRASVCMQERLAYELFAPSPGPEVVAWVSGINNLIALIVGEGAADNPAPFIAERQFALRMMPDAQFSKLPDFEERYRRMLRQFEVDLTAVTHRLGAQGRLGFFLQPSASWINKFWCAEEKELIDAFDLAGNVLQQAHHPRHLTPLRERYRNDLRTACARSGATFVDCNDDARFRSSDWLFIDRTHMTDAGHRLLGKIVAEWVDSTRRSRGSSVE